MATATFTTVNGMILHENRGGVETFYVPDPLGSLIACNDASGNQTYKVTYWPFGEIRQQSGTNPSPWSFVGLLGYFRDLANLIYVRMRYYRPSLGRWQTADPLNIPELYVTNSGRYSYADNNPVQKADPSGLFAMGFPLLAPPLLAPPVIAISPVIIELLPIIALVLGIALSVLLLLLALYGLALLKAWICGLLWHRKNEICGNRYPGDEPDTWITIVGECRMCHWDDPCSSLLYKELSWYRCALIRGLITAFCYDGIWNPSHWLQVAHATAQAMHCMIIYKLRGCDSLTGGFINEIFFPS